MISCLSFIFSHFTAKQLLWQTTVIQSNNMTCTLKITFHDHGFSVASLAFSNNCVSEIWDCHAMHINSPRHRWGKNSRACSWCLYSVHFHLHACESSKRLLYRPWHLFQPDSVLGSNTLFKIRKGTRMFFNSQRDFFVKSASFSKQAAEI